MVNNANKIVDKHKIFARLTLMCDARDRATGPGFALGPFFCFIRPSEYRVPRYSRLLTQVNNYG